MADAAGLPKINLMEGRCRVFLRPNSSYWWAGFHRKSRYIGESTKEKQQVNAAAFAEKWYFQKQMRIQGGNLKHPPRLLNGADIYELATNRRTSPDMIRASYAKHLDGEMMPNINKTKERIDGWGN